MGEITQLPLTTKLGQKWIVTGISGCGRIELLDELRSQAEKIGRSITVHDVGNLFRQECKRLKIGYSEERILDLDQSHLRAIRSSAIKDALITVLGQPSADSHFIGLHATFRWKHRIIPGVSYSDLINIKPDGFINIVDDVKQIFENNKKNSKWDKHTWPSLVETQEWMNEEEFITQLLADVVDKPMYIVAKRHNINNFADLFFTTKKKIYLSYPITQVRSDNPELLSTIQGTILTALESKFVVFNPLTIKDIPLTYKEAEKELPELVSELTPKAKSIIETRTIERDYRFIDQSDAIVVFYLTEKVSPGVLSEISYAHRNQKPVFMVYSGAQSPFLKDLVTCMEKDTENLMIRLDEFINQKQTK